MGRGPSENGIPMPVHEDGRVGVDDPCSERSYTELKVLGDGSFGTVWLCDWHSPVRPGIILSAMQVGAGARPDWVGKRLVALKRMKRVWEGGWHQARSLGELVSLRTIPPHPAVIPLYDAFISPRSRELYFVFECMEGNLYQLTKSRKGRPLAAGLVASCFHQIVTGLHHVHKHGYFHRDMKPENLLVTTTGLCDYLSTPALNHLNAQRAAGHPEDVPYPSINPEAFEKDVQVIVKLADFGLAREIDSKPPYTEYVSTRWYRAPEVLLRSKEYGAPVDMWALGTILAEMINLKPLLPGVSEIDQVFRICKVLGSPVGEAGLDERGRPIGGGRWQSGVKLALKVGFSFPYHKPQMRLCDQFPEDTPRSLVECIEDLLRYNPKHRMTSAQCMDHAYFHETRAHLLRMPSIPCVSFTEGQPVPQPRPVDFNLQPRQLPPSHEPSFPTADMRILPHPHDHRALSGYAGMQLPPQPQSLSGPLVQQPQQQQQPQQRVFLNQPPALYRRDSSEPRSAGTSALVHQLRELDLPTDDLASYGQRRWAEELASRRASEAALSTYGNTPVSANNSSQSLSNVNSSHQYLVSSPSNAAALSQSSLREQYSSSPLAAAYAQQPGTQLYQQQPMVMQLPPEHQQHQQQLQPQGSTSSFQLQPQGSTSSFQLQPQGSTSSFQLQPPGSTSSFQQPLQHQGSTSSFQQPLQSQGSTSSFQQPLQPQGSTSSFHQPLQPHGSTSPFQQQLQPQGSTTSFHQQLQPQGSTSSLPSVHSASSAPAHVSKLAPSGKKKKWGISSVFSSNGKSESSPNVAQNEPAGYPSLKRTQSGNSPADRVMAPLQRMESADPKKPKAKKEPELSGRDLARAKREAVERAQQERSRAVLAKRGQMIVPGAGVASTTEDWVDGGGVGVSNPRASASVHSLTSVRSQTSSIYGSSKAYDDDIGRNKARKHTEDDDHSSIGRGSMKSRSALTIGTIESDLKRGSNGRKTVLPSIGDHGEGHYEQINPMFRVPAQDSQEMPTTLPPFATIATPAAIAAHCTRLSEPLGGALVLLS
ncbi:Serine/threonine protein kinase [Vanrija albida]|uniref:Serine/threonine protein kinase n=1 Tax=Vanrija albida TaxID=181172 RepID=A0ABR3PU80_9TREE